MGWGGWLPPEVVGLGVWGGVFKVFAVFEGLRTVGAMSAPPMRLQFW